MGHTVEWTAGSSIGMACSPARLRALTVLPRAGEPSAMYCTGGGNCGQSGGQRPDKVTVVSLDVTFG